MTTPPETRETASDAIGPLRRGLGRVLGAFRGPGGAAVAPAPESRESTPFTDAITAAFEEGAARSASADATAAVETAASAYGRCFAAARVAPEGPRTRWITPAVLNLAGRELIRRGELPMRLYVRGGSVRGAVAGSWYVHGREHDRGGWRYQLTEYGPSGSRTRWVPADAVVHLQYAFDPARPWLGLSPVQVAAADGRLHANTVAALSEEAGGPRGHLLPVPSDGEEDNLTGLRGSIATLKGKLALVETTAAGWGEGKPAAPAEDWKPRRIGANPPDPLRNLRKDSAQSVLAACGVPIELVTTADGTGMREGWRRFIFGSVLPLARIVEAELSEKLETRVRLDFSDLAASDLAGRARAFQSMVGAGMEIEKAAGLAGLMQGAA